MMDDKVSPARLADNISNENKGEGLRNWLRHLIGVEKSADDMRGKIEEIIEGNGEITGTSIAAHERMLISNVLKLQDMTVFDAMVPRVDIKAVDIDYSLDELVKAAVGNPHSRYPVIEGNLDNILGFIHIKDLLGAVSYPKRFDIKDIMRDPMVVSPSLPVLDLLLDMRLRHIHIAFVVDEFGGIDGLVTIEDLVEEIVGEIEDEHDENEEMSFRLDEDGSYIVDARMELEELEKKFGALLTSDEREELDTLGGLVFDLAGEIPPRGGVFKHSSGMELEVLEADARRIRRIRLSGKKPQN